MEAVTHQDAPIDVVDLARELCPELKGFGLLETFKRKAAAIRESAEAAGVSKEEIDLVEDTSFTTFISGAREVVRGIAKIHRATEGQPTYFEEELVKALAGVEIELAAGERESFARTMEAMLGL